MSMALLIGIFILLIEISKKIFNNQLAIRITAGCAFSLVLLWFFYEGALSHIETCLLLVFSFLGVFSFQLKNQEIVAHFILPFLYILIRNTELLSSFTVAMILLQFILYRQLVVRGVSSTYPKKLLINSTIAFSLFHIGAGFFIHGQYIYQLPFLHEKNGGLAILAFYFFTILFSAGFFTSYWFWDQVKALGDKKNKLVLFINFILVPIAILSIFGNTFRELIEKGNPVFISFFFLLYISCNLYYMSRLENPLRSISVLGLVNYPIVICELMYQGPYLALAILNIIFNFFLFIYFEKRRISKFLLYILLGLPFSPAFLYKIIYVNELGLQIEPIRLLPFLILLFFPIIYFSGFFNLPKDEYGQI